MAEDPYDPNPESTWPKIMMVLAGIGIIILGVWTFAGKLISNAFFGH